MKKIKLILVLGAIGICFVSFTQLSQSTKEVPYPEGYREWKHIKTAIIGPKSPLNTLGASIIFTPMPRP
jgi:hypothetical protein